MTAGLGEAELARARAGFDAFDRLGLPSPAEEVWRYVDLDVDLDSMGLAETPGDSDPTDRLRDVLPELAASVRNIDGFTTEVTGESPLTVVSLERARTDHAAALELVTDVDPSTDVFAAAHDAFGRDGVFVHAPTGRAVSQPVYVDVQAVTPDAMALPQVAILAEDNADVTVVVHLRSTEDMVSLAVPRILATAGTNARVRVELIQEWGSNTTGIAHVRMTAGRDARVHLAEAGLGGAFSRLRLDVDLEGRGSHAEILGIYFGDGDQTLDYRAFMNHRAPNTTSEMFLKGAVADEAKSVFTGLIRIEPAAQKTNAHQTNRNLVLSDGAEAHSVPNLEILANDVRCGHGSTVGPLDEDQRYYLMSRGLDRQTADRLQVKGFFEEVLARFPHQEFEPALRSAAMAKYEHLEHVGG